MSGPGRLCVGVPGQAQAQWKDLRSQADRKIIFCLVQENGAGFALEKDYGRDPVRVSVYGSALRDL